MNEGIWKTDKHSDAFGQKKIWIDLDNTPHVPLFGPITEELERRGYSVLVTARDCFQVRELSNLLKLTCKPVGRHYGKNKILKFAGLCYRALQMAPTILSEKPDLALSHGSRAQLLLSVMLGIPSLAMGDYEHAQWWFIVPPTWLMVPDMIPDTAFKIGKHRILRYSGIKEDVYIPRFRPDPSIKTHLGLSGNELVVTVRPPANEAHYHNPQGDQLFAAVIDFLSQKPNIKIVLLPRNDRQAISMRKLWPNLCATNKVTIPEHVVDGLNLIWYSDLVISGGGTMNREAAALGVPVYSIFRGKVGAVDQYLAASGRLTLLESVEDVRTKIVLARRERPTKPENANPAVLQDIVSSIVTILASEPQASPQNQLTSKGLSGLRKGQQSDSNIRQLNALAIEGLAQMFDAERQLFCFRLVRTEHGFVREGISPRYTIISLLGLHQVEMTGLQSPIEVKTTLNTLLKNSRWLNNIGDLGLFLWLCAEVAPECLEEIYSNVDVKHTLTRYRDAREERTMELAWFLSGLAHQTLAHQKSHPELPALALKTFQLLKSNASEKGIFGHLARRRALAGVLRGRVGTFADQVYPIYALTRFAQAYKSEEAAKMARDCAEAICRVQGPLGQWYWHYDSPTGRVVGRYPVYAVHQDGMAPMALFALSEATGLDFSPSICKGLQWIGGNNELGCDLVDTSVNVIWRSIRPNRYKRYFDEAVSFLCPDKNIEVPRDMTIDFECRPYHLGWLLYAFARRCGSPADMSPRASYFRTA